MPDLTKAQRVFPMQGGPPIPWSTAEVIYEAYAALFGRQQSLERIAERGGFGWSEVAVLFRDIKARKPVLHSKLLAAGRAALEKEE